MEWEGPDALEPRDAAPAATSATITKQVSIEQPVKHESEADVSSDDGSEDEYVAEDVKTKPKVRRF